MMVLLGPLPVMVTAAAAVMISNWPEVRSIGVPLVLAPNVIVVGVLPGVFATAMAARSVHDAPGHEPPLSAVLFTTSAVAARPGCALSATKVMTPTNAASAANKGASHRVPSNAWSGGVCHQAVVATAVMRRPIRFATDLLHRVLRRALVDLLACADRHFQPVLQRRQRA